MHDAVANVRLRALFLRILHRIQHDLHGSVTDAVHRDGNVVLLRLQEKGIHLILGKQKQTAVFRFAGVRIGNGSCFRSQ